MLDRGKVSIPILVKRSLVIPQTKRPIVHHFIFLSIWAFALYTGVMGIDFNTHWDENKLFKSIRESIPEGEILPGWYNYPSMVYDLTVLSISPEILTTYLSDRSTFQENMTNKLTGKELRDFTVRARTVFLGIASLSILWTYLLVFVWTKQWSQALLSSAILASSWEFAYHARWLAPDAILMQLGILTILLVFLALRSSGRRKYLWLIASAVAAGMACATKYFGGIFLVPVFIGGYKLLKDSGRKPGSYIASLFFLTAVFTLTFLLITPGALLDTARMVVDVRYEIGHYRTGDMGYTVNAGWQHFSLLLVYLFGVFFSKYFWVSLLLAVFVLIGLYSLLKGDWKAIETWVFLSVPILFIPYMSQQRVMMIRNDLLLFPFLAILCARGLFALWYSRVFQGSRFARAILAAGLLSALLINFIWLFQAGKTISLKLTTNWSQELQKYLLAERETTFYLSAGARSLADTDQFSNVVKDPLLADKLIFVFKEVDHPLANRPGVYYPLFGPHELNFDYYPSWDEDERIMVMPMKAALPQKEFGFIYQ